MPTSPTWEDTIEDSPSWDETESEESQSGPRFNALDSVPRSSEELALRNFEAQRDLSAQGFMQPARPPSLSQEITQALSVSPQTVQNAAEVTRAYRIAEDLRAMGIEVPRDQVLADVAGGREVTPGKGAQIASGIQNSVAGLIGGMTDPVMAAPIAAAVMFPPIAPAVSAGFGLHMASQVPELARTAGTASAVGTPYEKAKAYSDLAATAAFVPATAVHAASTLTRPKTAPTERPSNAIQQESAGVLRDVREPEVAQAGEVQMSVSEGSPKAAETRQVITEEALAKMPLTEQGKLGHGVGIEYGITLKESDVPRLEAGYKKAGEEMIEAVKTAMEAKTPEAAAKAGEAQMAAAGRMNYYGGALQGAAKGKHAAAAGNYDLFAQKRAAEGRPIEPPATKGAPIEKAKEEVLTQPGITAEQVPALGYLPRISEISGMGEPSMPPTLESIRTQREVESRQPRQEASGTTTFPTEGTTEAMRKSAERATTSEMIPEPVQETIKTAPESFYRQQSMKRVEEIVTEMPDAELATVPRDSNLYTAAKLEQASRLFKRGENDAGYNVFVELEKEGTRLGQLVNQFKLLKGTRPEEVVRVINKTLEKSKKDPLNPKQEKEAIDTASKSKEADRKLDESTKDWEKNPTPENAARAEKALDDANAAGLELQRFVSRFQPRGTASIIKSVLQGNLLTPISEVANIVGNVSFLPFRAADRGVATTLDIINNYLTGAKRDITVQPIRGPIEALKGAARGAKQIPDIFLKGTGDTIKGETRAGLHPIKAWINQFSKNPEMPTTGGKLTLQDRVNLAIEGTFGVPAEAMLRGLGAGDVAFKEAAKARAIATELELAKIPKDQWSFAQKFPELFLDDAALQRIHTDTLQAVFQRPSETLNVITNWIRGKGEWFDLAVATVAPYKLTPWNIVGEILSYNPLIAFGRSLHDYKNGNTRSAKLNAGKYVVGSALTAAGWWLYKNGLMSPSLDQRDEAQKARILAGEVLPPNHINLSGLKRALSGGDPSFKPGDETADVFRAGGLAGSMFYMTANIGRDFERMPEVPDSEIWGAILRQSTLEQARFGMNQSFLSGVEGLLSAVREGNADNYIRQWGNTVASIPLPNTLTVMSRASREYKPEFREDTFKKQMENIIRNKLGVAGLDDYLPLKRDLWGQPMRETPEGRNAIMYHFFDVFKNKQVTSDPVPLELFRLWRKTTDTRVIPSLPEKSITVGGNTYNLNAAQQSRYAELVGQSRRQITDAIVVNPAFHKLPDEQKIDLLDKVYRAGLQRGKVQFWREVGGPAGLSVKPQRAGFAPE